MGVWLVCTRPWVQSLPPLPQESHMNDYCLDLAE
jgi:hypothetical protein